MTPNKLKTISVLGFFGILIFLGINTHASGKQVIESNNKKLNQVETILNWSK